MEQRGKTIDFGRARLQMVEEQIHARGIQDQRVLSVMAKAPRHLFLDEPLWDQAYEDHALPIGERQTISQPYMVALMTEALGLTGTEKVLEIGTGSGYQTAILAELASFIYSVERVETLAQKAMRILESLRYHNVVIGVFDGSVGWPEVAPFDAICVAAASPEVPHLLVEQLAMGGRLVIPIGDRESQTLLRVARQGERIITRSLTSCVFVPLIGACGWDE